MPKPRDPQWLEEVRMPGPNGMRFDTDAHLRAFETVAASQIIMEDDTSTSQFTPGCAAYAGYQNGYFANMGAVRSYAAGQHAKSLSYTPDGDPAANALDIEPGDATTADGPPFWRAKGGKDPLTGVPCLYGSASWVSSIISAMSNAGIPRSAYRVISAHYIGPHICSPASCGFTEADATQFSDTYAGRSLDATLCSPTFFGTQPPLEDDMPAPKYISVTLTGTGKAGQPVTLKTTTISEDDTGMLSTGGLAVLMDAGHTTPYSADVMVSGAGSATLVEVDAKTYAPVKAESPHPTGASFTEVGALSPKNHLWLQATPAKDGPITAVVKILAWPKS